jgi:hypothetical protein
VTRRVERLRLTGFVPAYETILEEVKKERAEPRRKRLREDVKRRLKETEQLLGRDEKNQRGRMKKKHKRSSIEALLAVQTVPVQRVAPTESFRNETGLQKFQREEKERERREEQARKAEAERPIRKAQEGHSRLLRELIDADILAGLDTESQFLAATAPNIGMGRSLMASPQRQ